MRNPVNHVLMTAGMTKFGVFLVSVFTLLILFFCYRFWSVNHEDRRSIVLMYLAVDIGDSKAEVEAAFKIYKTENIQTLSVFQGRIERIYMRPHILLRDHVFQIIYSKEGVVLATGIRSSDGLSANSKPRNVPPDKGPMIELLNDLIRSSLSIPEK